MSLLRSSLNARLRGAGVGMVRTIPAARRHESQATGRNEIDVPPTGKEVDTRNAPDYMAEVDQASSRFTPVPKRLQDGSEEGNVLPAAVLSGAPTELQARTVRIYRPTKTATQSGDWNGHQWRVDWDILGKGHRWENPLMGWQSSADFMQGTHVNFKSKEDAIRFVEKQGYEYFVQEPNEREDLAEGVCEQLSVVG